jgi:hypothetical protein
MSTSSNLRTRIRALFGGPSPEADMEVEPSEMPFDPEWEELLSWAEVAARPAPEPASGHLDDEEEEWAASLEAAKAWSARREEAEEREWQERIQQARHRPSPPEPAEEPFSEEAQWEAAIQRAKTGQA